MPYHSSQAIINIYAGIQKNLDCPLFSCLRNSISLEQTVEALNSFVVFFSFPIVMLSSNVTATAGNVIATALVLHKQ